MTASWLKRIDDQGADALLQLRKPVNKFPDGVDCFTLCSDVRQVGILKHLRCDDAD
jgi:hypothetical protein